MSLKIVYFLILIQYLPFPNITVNFRIFLTTKFKKSELLPVTEIFFFECLKMFYENKGNFNGDSFKHDYNTKKNVCRTEHI